MRLSREEFWVLDVTAQTNYLINLALLNCPNADLHFNKSHHGMTTDQLVDLLVFMQKQGDLAIYRRTQNQFPEFNAEDVPYRAPGVRVVVDYTPIWENSVFYPKAAILDDFFADAEERKKNRGQLPKEFSFRESLCFCATRQGAEKWEKTAQVDWNKYLDFCGTYIEDADLAENQTLMTWRTAALSEQTLNTYFEWKNRWDAHPDFPTTSSVRRYHTERIAPWKATYWKTFPEGFECDFTEYEVWRQLDEEESVRFRIFEKQYWDEHGTMFDWCNKFVKNFPFEGD